MIMRTWWMRRYSLIAIFAVSLVACRQATSADDADGANAAATETASDEADDDAEASDEEAAEADPFEVPDGTAEELLAYIETVQQLNPPRTSREEFEAFVTKIINASVEAATKVIDGEATDEQFMKAVQVKLQMLGIAPRFGIEDAQESMTALIEKLKTDKRPEVVALVKQYVIKDKVSNWEQLEASEREALLNELVAYLGEVEIAGEHLQLVSEIGDALENNGDPAAAAKMYNAVLPIFQASEDDRIVQFAGRFEGIARRLGLLGNEMEIEGALLDKTPFDWDSFRGKVVLVDFWATWCGPCRAEMPNVKENYKKYHDKGFEVVGISLDDNREAVEEYIKDNDIEWATLFSDDAESTGWEHPVATRYGISGIPATILVGADGKVVALSARGPELGELLQEQLGDPLPVEEDNDAAESEDDTESEAEPESE